MLCNTRPGPTYRSQDEGEQSTSEDDRKHLDAADFSYDCLARLAVAHGFIATAHEVVQHFSVHDGGI